MPTKIKALQANFDDLFDSKEAAVICYLSLERRFLSLQKRYNHLNGQKCNVCGELISECRAGHKQ